MLTVVTNAFKLLKSDGEVQEMVGLIDKIDDELSTLSTNAVQNKVVTEQINILEDVKINHPTTAQVGQLLSVKSVAPNGKITEIEAVDAGNFNVTDEQLAQIQLNTANIKKLQNDVYYDTTEIICDGVSRTFTLGVDYEVGDTILLKYTVIDGVNNAEFSGDYKFGDVSTRSTIQSGGIRVYYEYISIKDYCQTITVNEYVTVSRIAKKCIKDLKIEVDEKLDHLYLYNLLSDLRSALLLGNITASIAVLDKAIFDLDIFGE